MRTRLLRCAVIVLVAACSRDQATTTTIEPAEPRPGALPPALATVGTAPVIDTSGSPPPATVLAPYETVVITDDGIEMRDLIPVANTAFEIVNNSTQEHLIAIRGKTGSEARLRRPLQSNEHVYIEMITRDGPYTVRCLIPGHREATAFRTYVPG